MIKKRIAEITSVPKYFGVVLLCNLRVEDRLYSSQQDVSFLKTLSADEMPAAMIAKVTQRAELGPSRALPTARHARFVLQRSSDPAVASRGQSNGSMGIG